MSNNFKQPGGTLTLTAPYQRNAGQGALIDGVFGVAANTVAISVAGQFMTEGVFDLDKTSAQAWTDGQKVAWDPATKLCTTDLTKGPLVGAACNGGAANPSATGNVRLLGTGATPRATGVALEGSSAPTSDATAGARTYTAAEIVGGTIVRDCAGASRADVLPTAALLVAAVPGAKVGDVIECLLINGSDAAEVITVGAGAGGAFDVNQTAAARVVNQFFSKLLRIRLTNVTAAAEAYVVYF